MVRDWPGLAILFIMPAVLLIIITFTQESAIPSKRSGIKIAIVNADSGEFGRRVSEDLGAQEYFNFIRVGTEAEAREKIKSGKLQMAVVIPEGATGKLLNESAYSHEGKESETVEKHDGDAGVEILYDPALQKLFRDAIVMPVNTLIQLSAVKVIMTAFTGDVNRNVEDYKDNLAGDLSDDGFFSDLPQFPDRQEMINTFRRKINDIIGKGGDIELPLNPELSSSLVEFNEEAVFRDNSRQGTGILQNNIPAFTLFAMFFIVIPLAGGIINEKDHGTYKRMKTLPVSFLNIALSKITVFVIVCILQFIFLLLVGKYLMPLLGEQSSIDMRVNIPALLSALISSSLAAVGFGILVGSLASTHGQAATFGSVMVVILALLGGIFVPVHMLPDLLRKISMVSPLRWGTDAFLGVFARHEGIEGIWLRLVLLNGFFIISVLLSMRVFRKE
jgi:ABC-2 type transport system permease protein